MKEWKNLLKTKNEKEKNDLLSSFPNFRVTTTNKNKKCSAGGCVGNHNMSFRKIIKSFCTIYLHISLEFINNFY